MKDLIANRKRLAIGHKLQILGSTLKENGLFYSGLLALYYISSKTSTGAFDTMQKLRKSRGLPGLNSRDLNKKIWEEWDWSAGGDEWTPSSEWKQSLVKHVLEPRVPQGSTIIEIGPGAGRWTEFLIPRSANYTGIDLSSSCVEVCSKKFAANSNASFRTNQGFDLPGVADHSVDIIWSFDVFVHINLKEISSYLDEFKRVLKPGAKAIIHHGTTAGHSGGWRSDATSEELVTLVRQKGLLVNEQFRTWQDGAIRYDVGLYQDEITVIQKPESTHA